MYLLKSGAINMGKSMAIIIPLIIIVIQLMKHGLLKCIEMLAVVVITVLLLGVGYAIIHAIVKKIRELIKR